MQDIKSMTERNATTSPAISMAKQIRRYVLAGAEKKTGQTMTKEST
jgi:hypothetical protein